jgi:cytochrome c oxidase subunit 2
MDYFPMIELFRERASSFAGDIDWLFTLVTLIVGFWFVLTEFMFFWLLFKFRAKPNVPAQYITGKEPHLKRWITWPHFAIIVCDIFVIIFAVQVWYNVKQVLPEEDGMMEIDIIAQQWAWTFVHPGADNVLYTDDDIRTIDELSVENERLVRFNLKSKDVLHDFSVPVLRLKQDAIPGRVIRGWFKPTKIGNFDVQCAEMCGIGHGIMPATIHIRSQKEHQDWIKENSKS